MLRSRGRRGEPHFRALTWDWPPATTRSAGSCGLFATYRGVVARPASGAPEWRVAGPGGSARRLAEQAADRVRADLDHRGGQPSPVRLADGAHRLLPGRGVHPVDEQHAVQVVGLVLQAAGELVVADDPDLAAIGVEAAAHGV